MQNFYEATASRPTYPELVGKLDTDVCIIGGGLAGLCTAIGLIERGVRDVTLIESERVGSGASGRNGGFVFGGYSLDNAELLRKLGREEARHLYGLTIQAVEHIRSRIKQYEIDCDIVDRGVLLANWFDDPSRLERLRSMMDRDFGVEWQQVSQGALRKQLNTPRYHGGLFEPNAFHIHPLKYVLGLAKAVVDGGANIFEQSPACSIERSGQDFVIRTSKALLKAKHVVFAGGAYARGVTPRIERSVLPIATYVIVTEPLGAGLSEVINAQFAIYDTRFAFDYYRALSDTRVLWGGRISIFNRKPETIARLLHRDLVRVYPQLENVRIDYAWGGLMSYASHKMPQIGRDADGVWHALAFGGHGLAPTSVAGETIAEAIAEGEAMPKGFAAFGLTRAFGFVGLAAAQLIYTGYQLRDGIMSYRGSAR